MEDNVENTVDYPTRRGMIAALLAAREQGVAVEVVGNGRTLRFPAGYEGTDAPQSPDETSGVPQAPPSPSEPAETPTGPSGEAPADEEPAEDPSADEETADEDLIGDVGVEATVEPTTKRSRKRGA